MQISVEGGLKYSQIGGVSRFALHLVALRFTPLICVTHFVLH